MRYDGCDGGGLAGDGLRRDAHAGVPDRGLSFPGDMDYDGVPGAPQPGGTVCVLSHQLGTDLRGTSAVFPDCVSQDPPAEAALGMNHL